MTFDFHQRRFSLPRLRWSDVLHGLAGRLLVFLAGGIVFFTLIELGPLFALGMIFGLIPLGALMFMFYRKRGQQQESVDEGSHNLYDGSPIPFGRNQRTLNTTLAATTVRDGAHLLARPRYFMDPLLAAGSEISAAASRIAGPEGFVGFTLRRRFEDALDRSRYEDAARIIAEMAETTDNQAWCVNANRRLAYRRSRIVEPTAMVQH
jgi:hypothetical protein